MSTRKDSIGGDVVSFSIGGEGFHLVAAVRHDGHYPLDPIRVFRKRFDIRKRFGLSDEARVWSAVSLADFPALSSLASAKKSCAIAVIKAMWVSLGVLSLQD